MSTESTTTIRIADETDIPVINTLAHAIWPVTYADILSGDQLAHMLGMMYSPDSLKEQFKKGHIFLIVERNADTVAFASYSRENIAGVYRIHKLYVHPMIQGKGLGKMLIEKITNDITPSHPWALRLNVNRENPAKTFYEKLGFAVIFEEDIPIGDGYFMTDYVMEKILL